MGARPIRRLAVALPVAIAILASMPTGAPAQPRGTERRPTIVVIITDDMRADQLDAMPTVRKELVGRGRSFRLAFASDPLCCPSRLTFLRGQYAHTHSLYNTINPSEGGAAYARYSGGSWAKRVGVDRRTLATWLDDAGYVTAEVGKFLNGYDGTDAPPGWDRWNQKAGSYLDFRVVEDGRWVDYDHGQYEADVVTDHAVASIEASGRRPLFLWASYFAPHLPSTPPKRYDSPAEAPRCSRQDIRDLPAFDEAGRDDGGLSDKPRWLRDRGPYDAERERELGVTRMVDGCRTLLAVDDGVGRILAALRRKDPGLDDTIVVFTSDQGTQNGEHQHASKKVPYESTIRIPFVVRADGVMHDPGRPDRRHLVRNVDLAPTLLRLAGLDPSRIRPGCPDSDDRFEARCRRRGGRFEGRSFAPLLTGGSMPRTRYVLLEHWDPPQEAVTAANGIVPAFCGVRSATAKLIVYDHGDGLDWEAYDLEGDPHELRSLVWSDTDGEPRFRPGGRAIYHDLRPVLDRLCVPPPPDHAGP